MVFYAKETDKKIGILYSLSEVKQNNNLKVDGIETLNIKNEPMFSVSVLPLGFYLIFNHTKRISKN